MLCAMCYCRKLIWFVVLHPRDDNYWLPDLHDDSVVVFLRDACKVVIYLCRSANTWKALNICHYLSIKYLLCNWIKWLQFLLQLLLSEL